MGIFNDQRFASNNQVYETPDEIFAPLNQEFNFTLDVCANEENAKCEKFFDEQSNGLAQFWEGVCWMNPPFKNVKLWIQKAYQESLRGVTTVALVCAKTNTNWFHEYCLKGEVRFVKGRPKFKGMKHGLPFPLAVVIFRGNDEAGRGF
jgi:phage N-6-adenine-methyltransferase